MAEPLDIYDTGFIERLFDEMAATYERVNFITSFGFSRRWRRQFVSRAVLQPGAIVCDLMCGMGECWGAIAKGLGHDGSIVALDISAGMLRAGLREKDRYGLPVTLLRQDALSSSIRDESVDCVVSGFSMKTFTNEQLEALAGEMKRILKPGGSFTLVEVSVPPYPLLRPLYMFYLKQIIPMIGSLLRGNPANYRYLGIFTEKFVNARWMTGALERQGLRTQYHEFFLGCATGVSGTKPLLG
jgi:ubiquinone/menaquinone biosynthesis methyltransferase